MLVYRGNPGYQWQPPAFWPSGTSSSSKLIFGRVFDGILFQRYVENVKQDTNINTNILRVSASDEDADNNGAIRYSLTAPGDPSDLDYFDIQPESGWIYLTKPLDVSISKTKKKKS